VTLVDSSGWIEFLADGPLADEYARVLEAGDLLVPSIVLYEVYKVIRREVSEEAALLAVARMRQGTVVALDETAALEAADASLLHGLAMADAIVYSAAQAHEATLVTSDEHFANLSGVTYLAKG
jgi:predicted nucleic acid-binding protein